jgi:hypothetical protein
MAVMTPNCSVLVQRKQREKGNGEKERRSERIEIERYR